jgi:hypothetical protein
MAGLKRQIKSAHEAGSHEEKDLKERYNELKTVVVPAAQTALSDQVKSVKKLRDDVITVSEETESSSSSYEEVQ